MAATTWVPTGGSPGVRRPTSVSRPTAQSAGGDLGRVVLRAQPHRVEQRGPHQVPDGHLRVGLTRLFHPGDLAVEGHASERRPAGQSKGTSARAVGEDDGHAMLRAVKRYRCAGCEVVDGRGPIGAGAGAPWTNGFRLARHTVASAGRATGAGRSPLPRIRRAQAPSPRPVCRSSGVMAVLPGSDEHQPEADQTSRRSRRR
jgi:hypothetical protein